MCVLPSAPFSDSASGSPRGSALRCALSAISATASVPSNNLECGQRGGRTRRREEGPRSGFFERALERRWPSASSTRNESGTHVLRLDEVEVHEDRLEHLPA